LVSWLVGWTRPTLTDEEYERYRKAVLPFILERGAQFESWPEVNWIVNERPEAARFTTWAGAWAGHLRDEGSGLVIEVLGFGIGPSAIRLETRSSSEYHFDSARPLQYPDVIERSQEAAFESIDVPLQWPRHPDHERLLRS